MGAGAFVSISRESNTLGALGAVHCRNEGQADLVDQTGTEEGAVRSPAALKEQALYSEFAVQNLQRQGKVELGFASKYAGYALGAQSGEMHV